MQKMNLSRTSYLHIFCEIIRIFSFLLRYTYSLRNQLRDQKGYFEELTFQEKSTITNAVENQIKWIDSNVNAKVEEFQKQKKQLERTVLQIMSKIHGYKPDNHNQSRYQGEL